MIYYIVVYETRYIVKHHKCMINCKTNVMKWICRSSRCRCCWSSSRATAWSIRCRDPQHSPGQIPPATGAYTQEKEGCEGDHSTTGQLFRGTHGSTRRPRWRGNIYQVNINYLALSFIASNITFCITHVTCNTFNKHLMYWINLMWT